MREDLKIEIETYAWKSRAQKEGYLAFLKELKDERFEEPNSVDPAMVFLIQKMHEQSLYWRETVSDQIELIRRDLTAIMNKN